MTFRWLICCLAALVTVTSNTTSTAQDNPDRVPQPGVPEGKITSGTFEDSKIYPGTVRDYSVYVPAQYKPTSREMMVFMDGNGYSKKDGAFRVPVVFDNLIHQKAMPVTIAVFVNPGNIRRRSKAARIAAIARSNTIRWVTPIRSF